MIEAQPAIRPIPLPSAEILGVRVHRLNMGAAVAAIMRMLTGEGHHQVVTLNAAMLFRAVRDEEFRQLVNSASLVTPDGMGVLLVGRILGVSFPAKVSGVDLADRLCALSANLGVPVFLLGAGPGVVERVAENLSRSYPGLQIAGVRHGYYHPHEEPEVVQAIKQAGARLLLVGLGSPRQEVWIASHLVDSGAAVGMGVGGSFDVYAGLVRLAPEWVRRAGLEWAYRLVREPWRWRVAMKLPAVVLLALRERAASLLRGRFRSRRE